MYFLFINKIHTICSLPVQTTNKHFPSHHELVSNEGINHVSGFKATYEHIARVRAKDIGYELWLKNWGRLSCYSRIQLNAKLAGSVDLGVIVDMLVYGDRRHA